MKPYYEAHGITIYHGDCRDVLPQLPSVDLLLTDPPYGIHYASSWKTRSGGAPRVHESSFGADDMDTSWVSTATQCMKPNTAAFIFTRWDVLHLWKYALECAGLPVVQRIIWDKAHFKMGDLRYYGSQTEDVLFCRKGEPSMRWKQRAGNLYRVSSAWLREGQFDHPTQKPERLLKTFIAHTTDASGLVLDPFMGSGSTLRAAKDLGRRAIGIEIEERYCEIAARRLQQEVMPLFAESE